MKPSKWVVFLYIFLIAAGVLTALPNILTQSQRAALPDWMPHQPVTLGLDLQGGSQMVLAIDEDALDRAALDAMLEAGRRTLRDAGIPARMAEVAPGGVHLRFESDEAAARAAEALQAYGSTSGGPGQIVALSGPDVTLSIPVQERQAQMTHAIEQSLEVVRGRIDRMGLAEPVIQRMGDDRIVVQLPGYSEDPARLRDLLGSTAKLGFHVVLPARPGSALPSGARWVPHEDGKIAIEDHAVLGGERLEDARAAFDQRTGDPIVSFRFDRTGARAFGEITAQNVGRPLAIVLDGKVISAPMVRQAITGGSGEISGGFSVEDSTMLAAQLRAGALPAPLQVIEERSVGPDLGADVIRMGLLTGAAGFALVCALMVTLYRGWGLIANAALLLNGVLTLAILTVTGASLTLPGIAGFILSLGMAVDANILINERVREEIRKGTKPMAALVRGFDRAYATIVDANVTTLIATTLLFLFGSGPIRGFAVTMSIGILVSMFTAIAVVRIAMTEWLQWRRLRTISLAPLVRLSRAETDISFMWARFLGLGLSLFLSAASVVLFLSPGLNYGIDFLGGLQVEVENRGTMDLDALRGALEEDRLGEVTLQNVGGAGGVLVRAQEQSGGEGAQTQALETIKETVRSLYQQAEFTRTDVVGPKVSGELSHHAILAVALASLAMMFYIWIRFEWHFALGAMATLALDVTKTVGFFALTGLDFNLTAIAALLTIIGYSLNDKVVVYDRMRETIAANPGLPLRTVIDRSINEVLARCVYTSLATLLAILPMAVLGGASVASFAIPLVFGIVVATTSSIFIAAPILLFLGDWRERHANVASTAGRSTLVVPRS